MVTLSVSKETAVGINPMSTDSKIPSSRRFTSSEAPTVKHVLMADALAHLYEIREELETIIKAVEAIQYDSQLRMVVVRGLTQLKKRVKLFERYLGIY